jgi:GntR family transcriptional regulator, arabinose operon transcriptional repressor
VKGCVTFKTQGHKGAGQKLKHYLVSKIESGDLAPGVALQSTQELSETFEISLATAQKILKELADEKYLIRQHGKRTLVADNKALKLKLHKKKEVMVGAQFMGLDINPFHVLTLLAISNYGLEHNIRIVSSSTTSHTLSKVENVESFVNKLKDNGIEYCLQNSQSIHHRKEIFKIFKNSGLKTVVINDFWHGGNPFPCVRTNEEAGCYLMFEHLIKLGHRKILFLDEAFWGPRYYAINAFRQTLLDNSLPFNDDMVRFIISPDDMHNNDISNELLDYIIKNFTAVYCTYDVHALALIKRLSNAGIKVGKDISVAGFDGIPQARNYGLTTIQQPVRQLVDKAFDLLFDDNSEPVEISLLPELIIRDSTAPCPK